MDFHGFRSMVPSTVRSELWPLKKALLDSSWLLSSIFIDFSDFMDFHGFHDFHGFRSMVPSTVRGELWPL